MRQNKCILCGITVFLIMLSALGVKTYAAGTIVTDNDVALTVSYKDSDKAIPGAGFDLYRVANVDENAKMTLTDEFKAYENTVDGLSNLGGNTKVSWLETAATLKGYVQRDGLTPASSGNTSTEGILSFSVKPGLYLLVGHRATTDDFYTYTATPFMIFLPGENSTSGDWDYSVTVFPKFEKDYYPSESTDSVVTRKVLKVWDDSGYETIRPAGVVVQLLKDGTVSDTKTLNKDNNWRYAWDNLDSNHEWTIVEKEMPNYSVKITRNGITFTLENKYYSPIATGDPPVQKRITGDTPSTAGRFAFVMKADDASFPMPSGSSGSLKEMSIIGAGSVEFGDITFTKPGYYTYTVSEKNTGIDGYTYDTTVYTVSYTVKLEGGKLTVNRVISDNRGNTPGVIEFTNSYKTPGNKLPQTGQLWWPVPLLLVIGMLLVVIGLYIKPQKSKK